MESRRPGYPNMTRPDAGERRNLPLGAEPLIYSYLVSSTEAGCYFQGRIRILNAPFSLIDCEIRDSDVGVVVKCQFITT